MAGIMNEYLACNQKLQKFNLNIASFSSNVMINFEADNWHFNPIIDIYFANQTSLITLIGISWWSAGKIKQLWRKILTAKNKPEGLKRNH